MNKKVVGFTGFILLLSLLLLGYQIVRYLPYKDDKKENKVEEVNSEIQKIDIKIEEDKKKKKALEEEKAWKIEVFHTWEAIGKTF